MSVSKYRYTPGKCDGHPCPGDCDLCTYADDDEESSIKDTIETMTKIEKQYLANKNYELACAAHELIDMLKEHDHDTARSESAL